MICKYMYKSRWGSLDCGYRYNPDTPHTTYACAFEKTAYMCCPLGIRYESKRYINV